MNKAFNRFYLFNINRGAKKGSVQEIEETISYTLKRSSEALEV